ncbi:MAG: PEP-CTERM sorting domain-containing protein, partial [Chthoniobacterales bacterium]
LDTITLTDTVKLTLNDTIGGGLNVGASNILAGNGTIGGSLSLASGAKFVFSLTEKLTVNGPSVTFGGFGVTDLIGLNSSTPNGVYVIFDGLATINTNNLLNFGEANAHDLGGGKSAYFTEGSLELNVVPEPSTYALLALSALGLAGYVIRRRRR